MLPFVSSKKYWVVPRFMVILMLAQLGLAIFSCAWLSSVFHELDIDGLRSSLTAFTASCIWIPYFMLLKRVKATFIVDPTMAQEETRTEKDANRDTDLNLALGNLRIPE